MTHEARTRRRGYAARRLSARHDRAGIHVPTTAQAATEIDYAIWGDPAELTSQKALVDAFMATHPDINVKVTVSDWDAYWDKLQTGLAGGDAPDVFAMDGPLFPDYQSRDVLLDLTPYIERDGFDLTALADAGVAHFTTPERPVRPAARPERRRRSTTTRPCSTRRASPTPTTPGRGTRSWRSASS